MPDVKGPGPDRPAGNVFTRPVGPLPLWGWLAIATVVAVLYALLQKKNASNAAASTAATDSAAGGVDSSLVPQFVNQTYTTVTPPPAPPAQAPPTPVATQTVNAYSWTDTGQKWSLNQLASKLGISVAALKPTNALGQKAVQNPNAPIPKGAKFDYTKQPKGITTPVPNNTSTPKPT